MGNIYSIFHSRERERERERATLFGKSNEIIPSEHQKSDCQLYSRPCPHYLTNLPSYRPIPFPVFTSFSCSHLITHSAVERGKKKKKTDETSITTSNHNNGYKSPITRPLMGHRLPLSSPPVSVRPRSPCTNRELGMKDTFGNGEMEQHC